MDTFRSCEPFAGKGGEGRGEGEQSNSSRPIHFWAMQFSLFQNLSLVITTGSL